MSDSKLKKPFFAAFLENQLKETEKVNGGKSGSKDVTNRSLDSVTNPSRDTHQTMKYPSDSDETVTM